MIIDRTVFKDISYGMYFVSSINGSHMSGCVINTLCQITSNNPIISISLNKDNYTNLVIKESKRFAISIISVDTKKEVIGKFGYQSSKNINKFEEVKYSMVENLPVIEEDICGYLICEVIDIVDCGTHDIMIAKVVMTKREIEKEAMTYKYYHDNLKGVSPKNAPTYSLEEVAAKDDESSKYRCSLCGFIYDDAKEKVKFEDLPDDWKCPLCGAPKSMFEKI